MIKMADLHMHSSISIDGELPPEELARRCFEAGILTISLTDHNSIRGVPQIKTAAKKYGMDVISGVELDSSLDGKNLHILGYGIDEYDPEFAALEENILQQERYAGGLRIELIRKCFGLELDGAWLCRNANNGVVTGELIAEAALDEPYNQRHPLLAPYRPGGARSDNPYLNFYWDYCAPGKPAYVPIRYMHAREAIRLIHACGGVAVLAHPGAGKGCDRALVEQLIGYGLEGIEVHSNYHTAEQTEKYAEIAQANGLLTTCGSDFHGKTKPAISLGKPLCSQSGELAEGLKKSIRRRKIVEYPRKMKE